MATYQETQQALRDAVAAIAGKINNATSTGAARDLAETAERLANASRALKDTYGGPPSRGD